MDRLQKNSTAFGIEISAEKTKRMTNNTNGMASALTSGSNGEKLDKVDVFKYLESVIKDQGSKPEVLSRIAQTTAALARPEDHLER